MCTHEMGRKKKGGLANLIWEQPDQQRCDAFGSAPGGSMAFCYKENDSSIYKVKMSLTKNICSPEKLSRPRPHTPIMWDCRWIIVLREQKKAVQQSFVLLPFTKEIQKKKAFGQNCGWDTMISSLSMVSLRQHWNLFDGSGAVDVSRCVSSAGLTWGQGGEKS